jgi:hypothetical protein
MPYIKQIAFRLLKVNLQQVTCSLALPLCWPRVNRPLGRAPANARVLTATLCESNTVLLLGCGAERRVNTETGRAYTDALYNKLTHTLDTGFYWFPRVFNP